MGWFGENQEEKLLQERLAAAEKKFEWMEKYKDRQIQVLENEVTLLKGRVESSFFLEELADTALQPDEVKFAMGRIDDGDPQYRAVMKIIESQSEVELSQLLQPGRSNEERQYAAGRSAAVADMLHMLEQCRAEGRRLAQEGGKDS